MTATFDIGLEERITDLERELEREGWISVGSGLSAQEFSRQGIANVVELARIYYLKNPLIQRGVKIQTYYVFGRGINIAAKDATINACLQAFIDDPSNQRELSSAIARKERDKELTVDGNLFFVLFVHLETGKVRIGTLPVDEIQEIVKDRNNRKRALYYKRTWQASEINQETGAIETKQRTKYYRDHLLPKDKAYARIGDYEVDQDACIYHVKIGSFADWAFGISGTYAAQAWAKAYKQFLTDFASVVATLAIFAARKRTSGGKTGVGAAKAKLASTLGATNGETNPPRASGSVSIESSADEAWEAIKTANATTPAEQGRPLRVMVGAAFGLPDTMLSGDVDMGNLATAQSLDRPTEFQFVDRQELWISIYRTILDFVIYNAIVAPQGMLRNVAHVEPSVYENESTIVFNEAINPIYTVDFPSILEKDTNQFVSALLAGATFILDKAAGDPNAQLEAVKAFSRSILIALGFQEVDELLDLIFPIDVPPET